MERRGMKRRGMETMRGEKGRRWQRWAEMLTGRVEHGEEGWTEHMLCILTRSKPCHHPVPLTVKSTTKCATPPTPPNKQVKEITER